VPAPSLDAPLPSIRQEVVSHLLAQGREGAAGLGQQQARHWGLMYTWHGKQYLGAAHGGRDAPGACLVRTVAVAVCVGDRSAPGAATSHVPGARDAPAPCKAARGSVK
jgi:hypothetical protein